MVFTAAAEYFLCGKCEILYFAHHKVILDRAIEIRPSP